MKGMHTSRNGIRIIHSDKCVEHPNFEVLDEWTQHIINMITRIGIHEKRTEHSRSNIMGAYYLACGIKEALTHLEHGLPNTNYMTEKINRALDEFGMPSIHDEDECECNHPISECENTNMMEARYDLD